MGVDCDAVAGIGIHFDRATLEKFKLKALWDEFDEERDKEGFLEELTHKVENIIYGISGSYYSGAVYYHIFAKDNIWGVMDFISDLKLLGFDGIDKTDLIFIEETVWS